GSRLRSGSYDLLCALRPGERISDVIIVSMDEESYQRLGQAPTQLWDRSLHAKLLETLLAQGARLVVFDILFADAWPDSRVDRRFAQTFAGARGKVVLAASAKYQQAGTQGGVVNVVSPIPLLSSNTPWGIVELPLDVDQTIRRHAGYSQWPSLSQVAVETL